MSLLDCQGNIIQAITGWDSKDGHIIEDIGLELFHYNLLASQSSAITRVLTHNAILPEELCLLQSSLHEYVHENTSHQNSLWYS